MNKKLTAAFLVTVFVLSIIMIALPVQAHHTVGRPTGTTPYRVYDFDPHVPGPTGYVWPGAGVMSLGTAPNVGSGAPSPVTWGVGSMLPPGYQSPFTTNPQGAPTSWYQLAGNTYAPFGAILTSTEDTPNVGDLIFAVNFTTFGDWSTNPHLDVVDFAYHSITIYIPPEFEPPTDWLSFDTSNIATTITNERGSIAVWQAGPKDPIGPGWWVIWIHPGWWRGQGAANFAPTANSREILFSLENSYNEWYYIRVNGMTAPKIAGRYFFKMFLDEHIPNMNVAIPPEGGGGLDPNVMNNQGFPATFPVENYPALLVKGEVDPGIIEGTVRYGAWNQALYNLPLSISGRVRAVGVADDPYTGASTGRLVEARGYFNASAKGHYEIEGVAPGVYDIYASAAGYPEVLVASGVKIFPGKSFHLDFHLQPGPIITGVIFSKHSFGEVPWPSTRPISVEIYDSNEWPSARPGYVWGGEGLEFEMGTGEVWTDAGYKIVDAHLKSFSPINLTDSPYTSYVEGNVIYDPAQGFAKLLTNDAGPNVPRYVAFPIEGPIAAPTPPLQAWVNEPAGAITNPIDPTYGKNVFGLFNGVGPAQYWWVDNAGLWTNNGGSNSFRY